MNVSFFQQGQSQVAQSISGDPVLAEHSNKNKVAHVADAGIMQKARNTMATVALMTLGVVGSIGVSNDAQAQSWQKWNPNAAAQAAPMSQREIDASRRMTERQQRSDQASYERQQRSEQAAFERQQAAFERQQRNQVNNQERAQQQRDKQMSNAMSGAIRAAAVNNGFGREVGTLLGAVGVQLFDSASNTQNQTANAQRQAQAERQAQAVMQAQMQRQAAADAQSRELRAASLSTQSPRDDARSRALFAASLEPHAPAVARRLDPAHMGLPDTMVQAARSRGLDIVAPGTKPLPANEDELRRDPNAKHILNWAQSYAEVVVHLAQREAAMENLNHLREKPEVNQMVIGQASHKVSASSLQINKSLGEAINQLNNAAEYGGYDTTRLIQQTAEAVKQNYQPDTRISYKTNAGFRPGSPN